MPDRRGGSARCALRGTPRSARSPRPRAGPAGASPRAGPGPPSAATSASPGSRGTAPRATPPAAPGRCAARRRSACPMSKGSAMRSSSATRSGDNPSRQLADRLLVDLAQAHPALLVERRRPHLVEQRLDHGADAQHLGRLVDRLGRPLRCLAVRPGASEDLVGGDGRSAPAARHARVSLVGHVVIRRVSHGAFRTRRCPVAHRHAVARPRPNVATGWRPDVTRPASPAGGPASPPRSATRGGPSDEARRCRPGRGRPSGRTARGRRRPAAPPPAATAPHPASPSSTICSLVRTQATSPWSAGRGLRDVLVRRPGRTCSQRNRPSPLIRVTSCMISGPSTSTDPPTSTCPWSAVTTSTAPGGQHLEHVADEAVGGTQFVVVVLAQPLRRGPPCRCPRSRRTRTGRPLRRARAPRSRARPACASGGGPRRPRCAAVKPVGP